MPSPPMTLSPYCSEDEPPLFTGKKPQGHKLGLNKLPKDLAATKEKKSNNERTVGVPGGFGRLQVSRSFPFVLSPRLGPSALTAVM